MADGVKFAVSATPIEELTDENSGTTNIVASEIGKSLSGGGDSVDIANYSGSAANQGYLNQTVNYLDATHSAGGTQLSGTRSADFVFVKNTGRKFSTTSALGDTTTDCVMVVVKDVGNTLFYEVAWLKPGQAVVLPGGVNNLVITQFGSVGGDLHGLNTNSGTDAPIFVRTFESDGTAASDGNAVEYLVVT